MVSASVHRCCRICSAAGLTLAQSHQFHAKDEERSYRWLLVAGAAVSLASIAALVLLAVLA